MKTFGAFILTAFLGFTAAAQDTLYTTKGKAINGRITEITQNEIKYKSASNPDGPTYVMDKSDIVLIHYKNGTKEVFENNSGSQTSTSSNQNTNNNNNGNSDPVYVTRPNVNVVVGAGLPIAWGWGGWGWNRPYYGGYRYGYSRWWGGGYRGGGYGGYHHGGGGGFSHYGHHGHR